MLKFPISFLKVFLIILSFSIIFYGQKKENKPDFSGTWILDEEVSFKDLELRESFENYFLVINHSEPELKIQKVFNYNGEKYDFLITLFTDKRGETNKYFEINPKGNEIKTETFWKDNSIKINHITSLINNGSFKHNVENYKISNKGKTLTYTYRSNTVYRNPEMYKPENLNFDDYIKLVFKKKEN